MIFVSGATAFGEPIPGTWNASKLGTPELQGLNDPGIFKGVVGFTDPGHDRASLGDILYERDNSSQSGMFAPYYWGASGMVRDSMTNGAIVNLGGGVGASTFVTTRNSGEFRIWGDHLWGQATGTTYTAAIQGDYISGTNYYIWNGQTWDWDHFIGTVHEWGAFDDQFLFDFTAHITMGNWFDAEAYGHGLMFVGSLDNVELQIKSVPEPTTMLLLGLGLMGLAGIRKKL